MSTTTIWVAAVALGLADAAQMHGPAPGRRLAPGAAPGAPADRPRRPEAPGGGARAALLAEVRGGEAPAAGPAVRFEDPGLCSDELAVEASGVTVSSTHAGNNNNVSWCADANDLSQWMQWDFGGRRHITGVRLLPRPEGDDYVTRFRLQTGRTSAGELQDYNGGEPLDGCADQHTVAYHPLLPLDATVARIVPLAWHGHICARVVWLGCLVEPLARNTKTVTVQLGEEREVVQPAPYRMVRAPHLASLSYSCVLLALLVYFVVDFCIRRLRVKLHEERVDAEIARAALETGLPVEKLNFLRNKGSRVPPSTIAAIEKTVEEEQGEKLNAFVEAKASAPPSGSGASRAPSSPR